MKSFTQSEIKEIEKKFGGYQYLLTFRYANLCIKADPMALLPVSVMVGGAALDIEKTADVTILDDYRLAVTPKNQDLVLDIKFGILEAHPEFKADIEQLDEDDPASQFIVCTMPDVDKDRHDLLVNATNSLHDECEARMDAVLLEEKEGFAELLSDKPEGLKQVADELNSKYQESLDHIDELRDKKLEEIEEAYRKYCEEHSEEQSSGLSSSSGLDVTTSIRLTPDK